MKDVDIAETLSCIFCGQLGLDMLTMRVDGVDRECVHCQRCGRAAFVQPVLNARP